jgi:Fe-Mn family superoxide dismutase
MLEEEQKPLLLDVRLASDFDEAPQMISSAKWLDPELVDEWGHKRSKDREIIVYCVHGHRISRGAAARLRELGLDARILEGGIEAWKESGREVIPAVR